jgi:hypothetical protein
MQYIDAFLESGYVNNPVFTVCVNPNLPNTRTNALHGLPVIGVSPLLDEMKLKACCLFDAVRKCREYFVTVANPE